MKRALKLGAGMVVVGAGGGYYSYQKRLKDNKAITAVEYNAHQTGLVKVLEGNKKDLDRAIDGGVELYRFQTCPYCGTVSAMLDFLGIPYTPIEVDPMLKTEIKPHQYGKVPHIKFADGSVMVDSEEIVNLLVTKTGMKKNEEIMKWSSWARLQLSRYIVLNLNDTMAKAIKNYDYIDSIDTVPGWSKALLKGVGGPAMYAVAKYKTGPTLTKEFGYDGSDARAKLVEEMNGWVASFPKGQVFHGGKTPDLADLEVFGILSSCSLMPLHQDLVANTNAGPWINEMQSLLAKRSAKK